MQQHSNAFDRGTLALSHIQRSPVSYDIELLKVAATYKEFYVRATVREGGRSYPVRRYPSCLSAARPARDRAFYVPRLVLGVGTPRARNSECHSRHSFTGTTRQYTSVPSVLHCDVERVRETTKKRESMKDSLKVAATYSPTTQCSTIGDAELNDPVRNGKGWDLSAITT